MLTDMLMGCFIMVDILVGIINSIIKHSLILIL